MWRDRHLVLGEDAAVGEGVDAFATALRGLFVDAPGLAVTTALAWGQWAAERQAWDEAVGAFGREELGPRNVWSAVGSGRPRSEAWLAQLGTATTSDTAFALSSVRRFGARRGRTRTWSCPDVVGHGPAAQVRRRVPAGAGHVDLYERFRRIAGNVLEPTGAGDLDADGELIAILDEIRAVSGHEQFLRSPTMSDIVAAADRDPMVYVLATPMGGLLLIVSPDGAVRSRDLAPFTIAAVSDRITPFLLASGDGGDRRGHSDTLDELTKWLWSTAMGPMMDELGTVGRVTVVPCGLLALLPLHAAWRDEAAAPTRRHYLVDDVALSVHTQHDSASHGKRPGRAASSLTQRLPSKTPAAMRRDACLSRPTRSETSCAGFLITKRSAMASAHGRCWPRYAITRCCTLPATVSPPSIPFASTAADGRR